MIKLSYYQRNKDKWKVYSKQGNFNLHKRKEWSKKYSGEYRKEHKEKIKRYNKLVYDKIKRSERYYSNLEHNRKMNRKLAEQKRREQGKPLKEYMIGNNHPSWRGGNSNFRKHLYVTAKYKDWRQQVFIRDNFTCRKCKKVGGYLEAHHLKRIIIFAKEVAFDLDKISGFDLARRLLDYSPLWDINNGITLCLDCHNQEKKKDSEMIREYLTQNKMCQVN